MNIAKVKILINNMMLRLPLADIVATPELQDLDEGLIFGRAWLSKDEDGIWRYYQLEAPSDDGGIWTCIDHPGDEEDAAYMLVADWWDQLLENVSAEVL